MAVNLDENTQICFNEHSQHNAHPNTTISLMKDFFQKLGTETLVKVVVAIILGGLTLLVPPVRKIVGEIAAALAMPVTIPLWSILLLAAPCFATVVYWLARFSRPAYVRKYTEDHIDGILWRWRYTKNAITDLRPFCAKQGCGVELMLSEKRPENFIGMSVDYVGTDVYCTGCNAGFAIGNAFDLPNHARRKIEKKIRDGSWKAG